MALVCGKRNRFNFPIVYGQIFLLAKRAVNFLRGPFAPYVFVFSAPLPGTTPAGNLSGCRKDTGHRGSSVPRHAALLKHFVPVHGATLDRQTSSQGPRAPAAPTASLPWHHVLERGGCGLCLELSRFPRSPPGTFPQVTGLERGRKIKDCLKVMAMGKKTLVQTSLTLCKYPLELTLENWLHNMRVS